MPVKDTKRADGTNVFTILEECWRLRHSVLALSRHAQTELDDKHGAVWLFTDGAWRMVEEEFYRNGSVPHFREAREGRGPLRRLWGTPVRVTYDDDPETPPVQLLMEPLRGPIVARVENGKIV